MAPLTVSVTQTCAQIVVKLLDLAAARGIDDFDQLLDEVSGGATTATVRAKRSGKSSPASSRRSIDPEHIDTHLDIPSGRVRDAGIHRWAAQVEQCCRLRCPGVVDRVEQAGPAPDRLLSALDDVLVRLADEGDGPGAATLLPALVPLVEHIEPRKGRHGLREAVLAWAGRHAPALDRLDRCSGDDRCPACDLGEPCPLDTWREPLAPLAIGDIDKRARSFLKPNGSQAGTGAYTTWLKRGLDHSVADAALALVVQHWRDTDQQGWADTVARYGWDAGCRHPDVTARVAVVRAAPGTPADLEAAVNIIDTALATADGSTAPGWVRLRARRGQLAGLLHRATVGRPTGEFDADGYPVYAAPHHPTNPRRSRPRRFVG